MIFKRSLLDDPPNISGWGRYTFLAVVAFFLIALAYSTIYRAAWNHVERTDFTVYRAAGQAVIDRTNIYEAHNSRGWNYVYPPPFAILMVPFAKLSVAWGAALWYTLSLLVIGSVITMSASLSRSAELGEQKRRGWLLYELPAFLVSPWLISGIARCQASELMIGLMVMAVFFSWNGRPLLGGVSLACASLLKAFPIALLVYFLWCRNWRFVGGFLAAMLLGGLILPAIVFGWQKNLDYLQQWGGLVARPALTAKNARIENPLYDQLLDTTKPRNQSLESLVLTLGVKPVLAQPVVGGIALAMLGTMLLLVRRATFPKTQLLITSAFLTWNVLIPPVSESHYFGLLLMPLAVLTSVARNEPDTTSRIVAATVLFIFGCMALVTTLDMSLQPYRPLCWLTLVVWAALIIIASRPPLQKLPAKTTLPTG